MSAAPAPTHALCSITSATHVCQLHQHQHACQRQLPHARLPAALAPRTPLTHLPCPQFLQVRPPPGVLAASSLSTASQLARNSVDNARTAPPQHRHCLAGVRRRCVRSPLQLPLQVRALASRALSPPLQHSQCEIVGNSNPNSTNASTAATAHPPCVAAALSPLPCHHRALAPAGIDTATATMAVAAGTYSRRNNSASPRTAHCASRDPRSPRTRSSTFAPMRLSFPCRQRTLLPPLPPR